MAEKIVNNEWKQRPVKCAGCKPLRVISLRSNCGDIENGIAFAFEGQGGFVIDRNDLKNIVKEAEALMP